MPPASPSTARAMNDRLALKLLQERGPLSASQLTTLTGLARPTVADLIQRLAAAGLIAPAGESEARRRGPNARLYGIVADRAHLAALDMRTDGVRVRVADLLGTQLAEAQLLVDPAAPPEEAVRGTAELLDHAAAEAGVERLHSVAVGVPGLIDPRTARLRTATGLDWHRELIALLQDRLSAAVRTENESNLAALAELRAGAARDRDSFVFFWLGEGPGAAVILDGALRSGASGGAGEIGFLPVPGAEALPSAATCESGFHSLVCDAAVRQLAAEHGMDPALGAEQALRAAVEGGGRGEGVGSGEGPGPEAAFLDALATRIMLGAAAVTAVLDPGCLVLGGALGHAGGAPLAARVERQLAEVTPLRTEVRASSYGDDGVLNGALLAAVDMAQEAVFPSFPSAG
ncbi:ROK family transcriptional regulator [Streptomyces iconiensis]|uniref:ROK family transcriptional regulator n=1 Tax=Streptomyces iconiensis TaxID=1384038 RepID=A0ABT6ZS05_9ACTN|nr:ROK family transcriptional regulator [Streptomyces iconiensis]MDJ1131843.1 ROK family transcriptional regulator [Streptomyces iconiensis]